MLFPYRLEAAKQKVDKPSTILRDAKVAIKNRSGQEGVMGRIINALKREDISTTTRVDLLYGQALLWESPNERENRKAYLKQAYDTVKFYNTLLNMYEQLRLCDSVDSQLTSKGKVQPRYKRRTATLREKHRPNILNGGKYFLSKKDYANAFPYLDDYYIYRTSDDTPDLERVVVWATVCGYSNKNYDATLRYVDHAIDVSDCQNQAVLMEYKALAYKGLGDENAWLGAMQQGQQTYPEHTYFFVQLADYYLAHKNYDDAIEMCKRQEMLYPDSALYWYAESNFELRKARYHETIACADRAIALQPNHVDAHFNRAMSYIALAAIAKENACSDIHDPKCIEQRRMIQQLYRHAQGSMELVRKHEPNNPERWGTPLYKIYLNLNMGKEFDEIDNLLKK